MLTLFAALVLPCAVPPQVIKEVLRYRPPAPMVPQVAMKPFKLTDNYTVSCGPCLAPLAVSRIPAVCGIAQSCPSRKQSNGLRVCLPAYKKHAALSLKPL